MDIKKTITSFFASRRRQMCAAIAGGIICGLGGYVLFASRAASYLSDEPATCVNCHIMAPYYASWSHSSHARDATCNDCHVPHENAARKWLFKGMDGMRHAAVFMMRGEPQVIQAIDESAQVIMNNCVRCHEQLNTEIVSTGRISFKMADAGDGKACWDCHRDVPHGQNGLSSAPNAIVPYPESAVPDWLKKMMRNK